uniref:Uncharacterized protein n=1 Tax=Setaria italica TaxID=4555 RepID=K4A0N0_SETIT
MPDVTTNTEVLWNLKVLAVQCRCLVKCAATAADRCWKPCRRLLCQARLDGCRLLRGLLPGLAHRRCRWLRGGGCGGDGEGRRLQ